MAKTKEGINLPNNGRVFVVFHFEILVNKPLGIRDELACEDMSTSLWGEGGLYFEWPPRGHMVKVGT